MIVITFAMSAMSSPSGSWASLAYPEQQLQHAALSHGRALSEQLVHLDPHEQDDRRRVDVADQDEEDGEAAGGGLEVEDVRDEELEDERRQDRPHDHERAPRAGPFLGASVGRREAYEQAERH